MGTKSTQLRNKVIISLSLITTLNLSLYANTNNEQALKMQIEALKAQMQALEKRFNDSLTQKNIVNAKDQKLILVDEKRVKKLEKKVANNSKKINKVKAHDAGDNIKFDVDFRTEIDSIRYEMGDGSVKKNNSLLSNRLWLNMKYQPDDNTLFYGTLAYNKIYGEDLTAMESNNNSGFDWITNEAVSDDNELKVKEVYWLYKNDSFFGNKDLAWTASVGRRPSTDGLGINYRADQQRKSALSHTVNVEFDGGSLRFDLDKITGVEGMWLKFCAGRGISNASVRYGSADGTDYTKTSYNTDMAGLIFVPWDNGQYSVHMNYAKAWNLIGYNEEKPTPTSKLDDQGDMQWFTMMFQADGIGNEINDFLDNSIFFASFAMSKTSPDSNSKMLGSKDSQTGYSYWLGINTPDGMSEDGRFGLEWNTGSKYWRSMTYGEDTMIGSKIAARGNAYEAYYNKELTSALSASVRYTYIDYDYTGSNQFFGEEGTPRDTFGASDVKKAEDIMAYIRYRF